MSVLDSYPATVYVLDDDPAIRESVRAIARSFHFQYETVSTVAEFRSHGAPSRPSCLILDHAPDGSPDGPKLLPQINDLTKVIATIVCTTVADIALTAELMRAGVVTLFQKPLSGSKLAEAIDEAIAIDRKRARQLETFTSIQHRYKTLSERQKVVLSHMLDGRSNPWIAAKLAISLRTVDLDRAGILSTFRVSNAVELAKLASDFTVLAQHFGISLSHENHALVPKRLTGPKRHSRHHPILGLRLRQHLNRLGRCCNGRNV